MSLETLSHLKKGAHIHLIGICGTAMGGLAGMLQGMGFRVTGSDTSVYPPMSTQLEELGITIMEGYKKENLNPAPDFVIVGNVVSRTMEEAQALLASNIPYASLPATIGEVMVGKRKCISLCGTHGKTTSTALMAWVAECCNKAPGFLIGGRPKNFDKSFRLAQKETFVIEGDEYDTAFFDKVPKFIHYRPFAAMLTSVEFDHIDIYPDFDAVCSSFAKLPPLLPQEGVIAYFAEDEEASEIAKKANCTQLGYGFEKGEIQGKNIREAGLMTLIDIKRNGTEETTICTPLFGKHNCANVLGVYTLATAMGWKQEEILKGLATFQGVKRRQEVIGTPRDIVIIDDFAHHPTAVRLTAQAIRKRFKKGKLFLLFEPRSATSRRKVFQKEYIKALQGEWTSLIATPYNQASIAEEERFSSKELVDALVQKGEDARLMESTESFISLLCKEANPGDTILIMSNGGFSGLYGKLLKALES